MVKLFQNEIYTFFNTTIETSRGSQLIDKDYINEHSTNNDLQTHRILNSHFCLVRHNEVVVYLNFLDCTAVV